MEPDSPRWLLILVVLICFSAIFSAAETALTSISKIRVRNMMDEKVKNADKIFLLTENPRKFLSAILVGNNIVNILASSIATALAMAYDPVKGIVIATIAMTVVILIFGEITPKSIAANRSEKVSLLTVNLISIVMFILTPIVYVLNLLTGVILKIVGADDSKKSPLITESEFKTLVNVGHEEGVIEPDERWMINNVFDFGDTKAKDVMTPRIDMIAINIESTLEETKIMFKEERFSRFPVYKESIDNIVGVLYLKDMVFLDNEKDFSIEKYMREPFFSYESKSIGELFPVMRIKHIPLAIILDEYGGTSGILTIEDMVEEIVGEICDEYDEDLDDIKVIKEDEYIIDGSTKIDDVNEMIGTNLESEDFDTIGGYVIGLLGRFPNSGEKVETEGIKFVVEEIEKNRIEKLRIYT